MPVAVLERWSPGAPIVAGAAIRASTVDDPELRDPILTQATEQAARVAAEVAALAAQAKAPKVDFLLALQQSRSGGWPGGATGGGAPALRRTSPAGVQGAGAARATSPAGVQGPGPARAGTSAMPSSARTRGRSACWLILDEPASVRSAPVTPGSGRP